MPIPMKHAVPGAAATLFIATAAGALWFNRLPPRPVVTPPVPTAEVPAATVSATPTSATTPSKDKSATTPSKDKDETQAATVVVDCPAENARLCPEFLRNGHPILTGDACTAALKQHGATDCGGHPFPCPSEKACLLACLDLHAADRSLSCINESQVPLDLNAAWRAACSSEMGTLCRGVKPFGDASATSAGIAEPMVECLLGYPDKLSSACSAAIQAQRDYINGR